MIDATDGVCGINFICTGTKDEALRIGEWLKEYARKCGRLL